MYSKEGSLAVLRADIHDLVSKVKELALELGRTPTRVDFEGRYSKVHSKLRELGGYSVVLQAAGFETYHDRKIDNSVFDRSVERHLEQYEPAKIVERPAWPSIAVISDVHRPFQCERVIKRFIEYVGDVKPEHVVELGDSRDFLAFSKFPRSMNTYNPKEENALARRQHEEFWDAIIKAAPKAKRVLTLGNHCIRPLKRTLEVFPSAETWIEEALKREFTFDGVETILDPREEYVIGNIILHHGYKSKLGDHRDFYRQNVITGHTHRGGCVWRTMANGECIFELNSGYAADPFSAGLSYTPTKTVEWTHGFAAVNKYGPQFIPA